MFLNKVDILPQGAAWKCEIWEAVGDEVDEEGNKRTEVLELWKRDPVECIRELIGNPVLKESLHYAPEQQYSEMYESEEAQIYHKMWTADWWWETQVCLYDANRSFQPTYILAH